VHQILAAASNPTVETKSNLKSALRVKRSDIKITFIVGYPLREKNFKNSKSEVTFGRGKCINKGKQVEDTLRCLPPV
jgi:hypothetical protein